MTEYSILVSCVDILLLMGASWRSTPGVDEDEGWLPISPARQLFFRYDVQVARWR